MRDNSKSKDNRNMPNYYAVIPAEVRYSEKISSTAKLIYGEISALANKRGYCWANNQYFSDLYNISIVQISNILSSLKKAGFVSIVQGENNQRRISIRKSLRKVKDDVRKTLNAQHSHKEKLTNHKEKLTDHKEKFKVSHKEKFKHNSTRVNSKDNKENFFNFLELFPGEWQQSKLFQEAWNNWAIHRKEKKDKLTQKSVEFQIRMLTKYTINEAIEIINRTIMKGWRGLQEIPGKEYNHTTSEKLPQRLPGEPDFDFHRRTGRLAPGEYDAHVEEMEHMG